MKFLIQVIPRLIEMFVPNRLRSLPGFLRKILYSSGKMSLDMSLQLVPKLSDNVYGAGLTTTTSKVLPANSTWSPFRSLRPRRISTSPFTLTSLLPILNFASAPSCTTLASFSNWERRMVTVSIVMEITGETSRDTW